MVNISCVSGLADQRENLTAIARNLGKKRNLPSHVWWPNINGATGGVVGYWGSSGSGAFSTDQNAQADLIVGSVVAYTELSFDASKASSVYNGSRVQSPALQLLPCIRT